MTMSDSRESKGNDRPRTVMKENRRQPRGVGLLKHNGLLVVVSKNFFGRTFVIQKPAVTVGRRETCDFIISDDTLSREHCRITVDEKDGFTIEDLSSTNSTWINSSELKGKSSLHYGDRLLLGETILRFFLEETTEKK
jgi:pSer/pThr/pTyr-binding forkhead associated (FHA) protein